MLKVNNRNPRAICEICLKLTIKTPERPYWRHSSVFIVNFKHISHLALVFLLLSLSRSMPTGFLTFEYAENSTNEINKLISQRWLKNFMEPERKQRTREAQNEKSKLRVRLRMCFECHENPVKHSIKQISYVNYLHAWKLLQDFNKTLRRSLLKESAKC